MPGKLRRSTVAAAVVGGSMVLASVPAMGLVPSGGSPVPRLAPAASLPSVSAPTPSVPSVSVPTPSVPSVPIPSAPTPSVPSVSVPSAPSAPQVSTPHLTPGTSATHLPSVSTPSTSGLPSGASPSGSQSTAQAGGGGAAAAGGSSQTAPSQGQGSGPGAPAAAAAQSPSAFAHLAPGRAGDRQISARVRALRGCLDLLPSDEHRLLDLRAGVGGPPQSLSRAAAAMGISAGKARSLQHRGLVALAELGASGCATSGSSQVTETISVVTRGGSILPLLSPATLATSAPQLQPPIALAHPQQHVLGAVASSPPQDGSPPNGSGVTRAVLSGATAGPTSIGAALWGLLAALLCALALSALIARRRRQDALPAGPSLATVAPAAERWLAPPPRTPAAPPVPPPAAAGGPLPPPRPVEHAPPPTFEHAPPPNVEPAPPVPGFPELPDGEASLEIERTFRAPQPPPPDSGPLSESLERSGSPTPTPPVERLKHVSRPAAVIASGVLSIALRRLLRGKRR